MTRAPAARLDWSRLAAVSLVRNEADIIGSNLEHLYGYGMRRFVVVDNTSTDATRAVVEAFALQHPAAKVVIIADPEPAHAHARKINAAAGFAQHYFGVPWIWPFDADDFLWLAPGDPIDLDQRSVDFIELPWLHAHPAVWPFAELAERLRQPSLQDLFRSTGVGTKVMVRWAPGRELDGGNHTVHATRQRWQRGIAGSDLGMACVHYPIRSRQQFEAKVSQGAARVATLGAAAANEATHWKAAAALLTRDHGRTAEALFAAFVARDAARFEALCQECGVPPAKLAYIHPMATAAPIAFPPTPLGEAKARPLVRLHKRVGHQGWERLSYNAMKKLLDLYQGRAR